MAILAEALASQGNPVVYVANEQMSAKRAQQGWKAPALADAQLHFAPDKASVRSIVRSAPANSIHLCQGLRGNGLVAAAQQQLRARGLRQWVVMETVDDAKLWGWVKRLEYARLFLFWRKSLQGVLATGYATDAWVQARGIPKEDVYPFAYFLQQLQQTSRPAVFRRRFRFVFVGNLIKRKRLSLLIKAIAKLPADQVELAVIGFGPLDGVLHAQAEALLPGRVDWIGRLPMELVPAEMARADCLVLPSRHDGWGAVVSEALMVGTPVICSDRCGAAGVALASGHGGVFRSGDADDLQAKMQQVLTKGPLLPQDRTSLTQWAYGLGAEAGANYLLEILAYTSDGGVKPLAPWKRSI